MPGFLHTTGEWPTLGTLPSRPTGGSTLPVKAACWQGSQGLVRQHMHSAGERAEGRALALYMA